MTKDISCECNSGVKNIIYVKIYCVWNPSTCICEHEKYLAGIMDDSVVACDEIIDVEETNFEM